MKIQYIENPKNLKRDTALLFDKNYINCIHGEKDSISFGAYDNNKLIGFISSYLKILDKPFNKKIESLFIDSIVVSEKHRKQGIGRKLIQLTEEYARKQDLYQVESWSSVDKKEALNMWHKSGYGLCSAIDKSERTGEIVEGYRVVKTL